MIDQESTLSQAPPHSTYLNPLRILVVDDEREILDLYCKVLCPDADPGAECGAEPHPNSNAGGAVEVKGSPYSLTLCSQGDDAVEEVRRALDEDNPFAVVFLDMRMPPGPDGVVTAEQIRFLDPDVPIVIVTGFYDVCPRDIARRVPPVHKLVYLQKPIHTFEIQQSAAALGSNWRMERELRRMNAELERRVEERTTELAALNEKLRKDIEVRIKAEEELAKTQALLLSAIEQTPAGILIADAPDVKIRVANSAALSIRGGAAEELTGIPLERHAEQWNTYHPDGTPIEPEDLPLSQAVLHGKTTENFEVIIRRQDGEDRWVLANAAPVRNARGEIVSGVVVFPDITERKRAEQALRESEEKYRLLVENANDAIFIVQDGILKFPNPKTLELLGYSRKELEEIHFAHIVHPEDRNTVMEHHRKGLKGEEAPHTISCRIVNRAAEELWVQINTIQITWEGRPATLDFLRDITSQKRLEAQFQQAQKMEAVGTLAGGIAHDFNNLLQAVQGYSEMLLYDKKEGDPGFMELQEMLQAAIRGGELTQQLLTFSRKVESRKRPLNLNNEVRKVRKLLDRTIPKMIEIELHLAEDLKTVNADPAQVEQVLINLAVNAKDAMPEGGRMKVCTRKVRLGKDHARTCPGVPSGEYVLLTISDTGTGMSKETLDHLFEPFFTTKEVGKGTGLGLAMVYGVIRNHEGYILCDSRLGEGTTFSIYLPVLDKKTAPTEKEEEDVPVRGGTETVLLVEDEKNIRELAKQLLERHGYRVLAAESGEQALEIFRRDDETVDLVLLDLIMPGIGGKKCLEKLLAIDSKVRVLIASGYSAGDPSADLLEKGARGYLKKPYDLDQMLKSVRSVLDGE